MSNIPKTDDNNGMDDAIEAPYPMTYRTISTTRFEGDWPRPLPTAVNENLMDDDDDSFYEIAKAYLDKFSE